MKFALKLLEIHAGLACIYFDLFDLRTFVCIRHCGAFYYVFNGFNWQLRFQISFSI